jgi:nucleotide-binding universal stress UspA family protein
METRFHAAAARPHAQQHPRPSSDRTVLAVCDLSSAAINAAWRAARVARELGASLRVLHPQPEPKVLSRAQAALEELTADIRARMGVPLAVEAVTGSVLRRANAAAREASLLVIPSRRGNPLREWIMGTQAERLIRLSRAPVLVVKRPALASYRRVLVPVALAQGAAAQIALAGSLARGSQLEVLHALDTSDEAVLREMDSSEQALRSYRQLRAQRAHLALHELVTAAGPRAGEADTAVEFGDAASVALARAQRGDAELMVIGKRRRGLLADYFLGGVTQRVLAAAPADVLVLPAQAGEAGLLAQQVAAPLLAS